MKKFYKIMAMAFAMALVVASPTATITSHAYGFNIDAPEHYSGDGKRPSDSGSNSGSSDSGSSKSSESSSSDSSSSGSSSGGSYDNGGSDNSGSYDSGSSYSGNTANNPNDVTDAKGNAVAYSTVKLEQGEDNLWYENITFAEGVDTKGLTLNVTKGDYFYLGTELGVSGIKINGKVVLLTTKTNGFNANAPENTSGDGKKPSKK